MSIVNRCLLGYIKDYTQLTCVLFWGLIIYPPCQSVMVNIVKVCSTSMQDRTWMDERETIQSTIDLLNRHVKFECARYGFFRLQNRA